jgi:hypothetical protein
MLYVNALTIRTMPIVLMLLCVPVAAHSQDATPVQNGPPSIASEITSLTGKFNSPDPSVQLDAYNDAFSNPNPIIRQMALSSASNSTNPEIRAIALMGAFSHVKSLVLTFNLPESPDQAGASYNTAASDQETAKQLYNASGGMVTVEVLKFDSNDGSFTYVTNDPNMQSNLGDKQFSVGTITGETIQMNLTWRTGAYLESCPTILNLDHGKLSGTITCTGGYTMIRAPVTATIF